MGIRIGKIHLDNSVEHLETNKAEPTYPINQHPKYTSSGPKFQSASTIFHSSGSILRFGVQEREAAATFMPKSKSPSQSAVGFASIYDNRGTKLLLQTTQRTWISSWWFYMSNRWLPSFNCNKYQFFYQGSEMTGWSTPGVGITWSGDDITRDPFIWSCKGISKERLSFWGRESAWLEGNPSIGSWCFTLVDSGPEMVRTPTIHFEF